MANFDAQQAISLAKRTLDLLERLSTYWFQFFVSAIFMGIILVACFLLVERRLEGDVPKSSLTDLLPFFYDVKLIAVIAVSIAAPFMWFYRWVRSDPNEPSSS